MNKAITICTITLLSISLTACGTNNKSSDSNNSAALTSASTKKKYYKVVSRAIKNCTEMAI